MIFWIWPLPTVPSGYPHENKAGYIRLSGFNWNTNCYTFDRKVVMVVRWRRDYAPCFRVYCVRKAYNSGLLGKITGSGPVPAGF
jgi:hypothetical protein